MLQTIKGIITIVVVALAWILFISGLIAVVGYLFGLGLKFAGL